MDHSIIEPSPQDIQVHLHHPAARIPCATYRLQFHHAFTFADATQLVPYLHALGISDCYASPYFTAAPGSPHGYDVIDHNHLNPEVGSEEDYYAFAQALHRYGMGQLLDLVPNHMGIAKGQNPWWADVLENGPSSPYATFFDIDWAPLKPELANKVLLPILGDQYGRVLENQEFTLSYDDGAFFLLYYDHRLPIAPRPTTLILLHRLGDLQHVLGPEHPHFLELCSIITALEHLPLRTEIDRQRVIERHREKEIIRKRLATVIGTCPELNAWVTENLAFFNGSKDDPASFAIMDALLAEQAYRLTHWRVAADEINYRRFFDVNDLAALRTEDPTVFAATHHLALRLLAEGHISGLRVDHLDGLYDPASYLYRLQRAAGLARSHQIYPELPSPMQLVGGLSPEVQSESSPVLSDLPCYLIVEKILGTGEALPERWPIHGTTGYDFLATLNGIFVNVDTARFFTDLYARFTRTRSDFSEVAYQCKKLIMQVALSGELNILAYQLNRLAEQDYHSRDFTLNSLTHALREIIACFPVYRTYIDGNGVTEHDAAVIDMAISRAKGRNPATDVSVFHYVRDVLLLRVPETASDALRRAQLTFVMKFQQYTGPVTAKGVEDTAFYIYNRLISLNEVGNSPGQFGTSLSMFHEQNRERQEHWPHALLATTTHDTKRSEDVRARVNVLSELPKEWQQALSRWSRRNKKKKVSIDGQLVPDRNEEYLLYQTLLGVWPLTPMNAEAYTDFKQRMQDYMRKATKEAKVNTSWINPHLAYDDALQQFVSTVLDDFLFLEDFQRLCGKLAQYGLYNSLSQTLLKLTVPGVPDIYQGTELWDFSLVDPDNRRPVDYSIRRQLLSTLEQQIRAAEPDLVALVRELLDTRIDGRIKLYITQRTLTYRRTHAEMFLHGTYVPLESLGSRQAHVCAFARQHESEQILVVVPRFFARLIPDPLTLPVGPQVWDDAWLLLPTKSMDKRYHNVFTGQSLTVSRQGEHCVLPLAEVFAHCPVALLTTG